MSHPYSTRSVVRLLIVLSKTTMPKRSTLNGYDAVTVTSPLGTHASVLVMGSHGLTVMTILLRVERARRALGFATTSGIRWVGSTIERETAPWRAPPARRP